MKNYSNSPSTMRRFILMLSLALTPAVLMAAEPAVSQELFTTNNLWIIICTSLVFIMHLGFACIEIGFTQSKNCVNILYKNTAIPAIGLITYTYWGFNLMYPGDGNGYFAFPSFGLGFDAEASAQFVSSAYNEGYTYWTDFIFQGMFAATAATIVSGAVAERIKLGPFLVFSALLVGVSYPITGYWKWGGGWLDQIGFYDFAGSTLVHSVGGWAALVVVFVLGPRLGKYTDHGMRPIMGHSMPLATIGMFLLWLGWFGFNGGSVLSADPAAISLVIVTTNLGAAAGVFGSILATAALRSKPDLGMALNGALAGLVSITAAADLISPNEAVIVGLIGGVLVVVSVRFFDNVKLDDPVGALSVHLVCGIWGTLVVGLFGSQAGTDQLITQLKGVVSIGFFTVVFALIAILILKFTVGIRVSKEEEEEGLDYGEHGAQAYPYFNLSHKRL